jgi:hypothetical protein
MGAMPASWKICDPSTDEKTTILSSARKHLRRPSLDRHGGGEREVGSQIGVDDSGRIRQPVACNDEELECIADDADIDGCETRAQALQSCVDARGTGG